MKGNDETISLSHFFLILFFYFFSPLQRLMMPSSMPRICESLARFSGSLLKLLYSQNFNFKNVLHLIHLSSSFFQDFQEVWGNKRMSFLNFFLGSCITFPHVSNFLFLPKTLVYSCCTYEKDNRQQQQLDEKWNKKYFDILSSFFAKEDEMKIFLFVLLFCVVLLWEIFLIKLKMPTWWWNENFVYKIQNLQKSSLFSLWQY